MEDERTELMRQILYASKEGCTQVELGRMLGLSHSRLRKITAELTDRGFLRHIGAGVYMTTENGHKFIAESVSQSTDKNNGGIEENNPKNKYNENRLK